MPETFEYAVLRVVPRVERGEFLNAGVIFYCSRLRFLDVGIYLDHDRLRALDPALDPALTQEHLEAARRVCTGGPGAGAIGRLPPGQRFGFLIAPRSTVVQASPVHTGLCEDLGAALEHLMRVMVHPPR